MPRRYQNKILRNFNNLIRLYNYGLARIPVGVIKIDIEPHSARYALRPSAKQAMTSHLGTGDFRLGR